MAIFQPCPSSPMRQPAGMRASVKKVSVNPYSPVILRIGLVQCRARSWAQNDRPSYLRCGIGVVLASRIMYFAKLPMVVQIFWPLMTYSSPSRTAPGLGAAGRSRGPARRNPGTRYPRR